MYDVQELLFSNPISFKDLYVEIVKQLRNRAYNYQILNPIEYNDLVTKHNLLFKENSDDSVLPYIIDRLTIRYGMPWYYIHFYITQLDSESVIFTIELEEPRGIVKWVFSPTTFKFTLGGTDRYVGLIKSKVSDEIDILRKLFNIHYNINDCSWKLKGINCVELMKQFNLQIQKPCQVIT